MRWCRWRVITNTTYFPSQGVRCPDRVHIHCCTSSILAMNVVCLHYRQNISNGGDFWSWCRYCCGDGGCLRFPNLLFRRKRYNVDQLFRFRWLWKMDTIVHPFRSSTTTTTTKGIHVFVVVLRKITHDSHHFFMGRIALPCRGRFKECKAHHVAIVARPLLGIGHDVEHLAFGVEVPRTREKNRTSRVYMRAFVDFIPAIHQPHQHTLPPQP